ncbi:MAG: hypothetical protein OXJ53_13520 [Gammaproteobacteria bacterium]|nr:hypothetical protein [Gammaproteobacteria bacterium]MDE0273962.1 hypothetical protein [Gammaproteobacteria bacterium]
MTIENSAIAAQTRPAVESLVNNVQRVVDGKAYGINEQGDLIGDALRSSFRGKIADLLVRTGIAKPGNVGGRFAAALVGRENFNLIAEHRANPDQSERSSVLNAIATMSNIKRTAVQGDSDLMRVVGSELDSKLTARATLRELVPDGFSRAGKLMEMHKTLHEVVIPQRIRNRQIVLENIRYGQPTAAMRGELAPEPMRGELAPDNRPVVQQNKVYPDELRAAARAILDPGLATGTGELGREGQDAVALGQVSGGGRRASSAATARAESILTEFNRACQLIRAESPKGGDEALERVEKFRKQYVAVLEQEFNRSDAEDGARTRREGAISRPVHDAGVHQSELDREAKTPFVAKEPFRQEGSAHEAFRQAADKPIEVALRDAIDQFDVGLEKMGERAASRLEGGKSVSFGVESRQEFAMRHSTAEFANIDVPQPEFPGAAPFKTRGNAESQTTKSLDHIEALLDPERGYASHMSGKTITPMQLRELADPDNADPLNFHQLTDFAQELKSVFLSKDTGPADRAKAAHLAGHPNFAQHLDTIKHVLPILDSLKTEHGSANSENAYQIVAPVMRSVAEAELAQAQDRLDRPDAPENAEWYQSYEDAFIMDVADPDRPGETRPVAAGNGRAEAMAEAQSVVKEAQGVIKRLDAIDAHFGGPEPIAETDD